MSWFDSASSSRIVWSPGRRFDALRRTAKRVPLIHEARPGSTSRSSCQASRRTLSRASPASLTGVEWVGADQGVWCVGAGRGDPPAMQIQRHRLKSGTPLGTKSRVERLGGGLAPARGSPNELPAIVVCDAHQVPVPLAVGDLINTDTRQIVEAITRAGSHMLGDQSSGHPAHSRPIDTHQRGDGALRGGLCQIHARVFKRPRETGSGPRPRD